MSAPTHCKSCGAPYGKSTGSFCDYCGTALPARSLDALFQAHEPALRQLQQSFDEYARERTGVYGMSAGPAYAMSACSVFGSVGMSARPMSRGYAQRGIYPDPPKRRSMFMPPWFLGGILG